MLLREQRVYVLVGIGSHSRGRYLTGDANKGGASRKEPTMNRISRLATAVLVSGSLSLAGLGLAAGTAQALPGGPAPLGSWPGCPADHPEGPCRWCPGDPPVQTGNLRVNPVVWDNNVCHTYWYVYHGQGNVAQNIFEGELPPPPPPPPPGFTPPLPPGQCWYLFIPGPC
jgi:hypothetical protein